MHYSTAHNYVLVKPDKNLTHYKFDGGAELFARTDINPQNFWSVTGTVLSVPENLIYNGHKTNALKKLHPKFTHNRFIVKKLQDLNKVSCSFDTPIEVVEGDKVYFHYIQHDECQEDGRIVEIDGDPCYFIPYDQLYLVKREKDVVMLNGYVLVEPIGYQHHDLYSTSGLKIKPTTEVGEDKPGYGKVRYTGSLNNGYLGYREWVKDADVVNPGDMILFKRLSDVPLEFRYLETFDGLNRFYLMQRRDIYAIITN